MKSRAAARQATIPDTFLRDSGGSEAFTERIAAARSLLSYALDRALVDPDGATGIAGADHRTFSRVALMLAKVADGDEAAALSREAATQARGGSDPALDRGPAPADPR